MFDSVSRARGTAAFLEARKRRSERRGAQGANSEETKINLQDVQVVDLAAPRPHRVSLPGCAEKGGRRITDRGMCANVIVLPSRTPNKERRGSSGHGEHRPRINSWLNASDGSPTTFTVERRRLGRRTT
ncbi:unnamed protein product [Prorocentrum cordatum]|uniref:Uncharacterized protein n=1 Tax=Prorocentrum cordatum TaxID=2364126 RepID=A0ABN9QYZ7_9DINO|nr:unnamed protein product [Polarella glacialis]